MQETGKGAFVSNRLLEYDWEGNLMQTFNFDVGLRGITYDEDEGLLYGITGDSKMSVVKLKL